MMVLIILSFCALLFLIAALVNWNMAAKPNKNVLFGVTLPREGLESDDAKVIRSGFRRQCALWLTVAVLTFLILIPLYTIGRNYMSLIMAYFIAWTCFFFICCLPRPYIGAHRKLNAYKQKNGWVYGIERTITVDTEASRLKNQRNISALWFLPPFILSAAVFCAVFFTRPDLALSLLLPTPLSHLAVLILFVLFFRISASLPVKAVSESSAVNIALATKRQRLWSIFWVSASYVESLLFAALYLMLCGILPFHTLPLLLMIAADTLLTILILALTGRSLRREESLLLQADSRPIRTDDDAYWIGGMFYCNPNDRSMMVERRIGTGSTVNLGSPKGKAFMIGAAVFTVVIVFGVLLMLLFTDFDTPRLDIGETGITVHDTFYPTHFSISDIRSVTLSGSIPSGLRTNGAATNLYMRGYFHLDTYGNSLLYVYNADPHYIVITLPGSTVIYNEKGAAATLQLYQKLKDAVGNDKT